MNVETFSLALADPLVTAAGTIERRDGFLIQGEHRGRSGTGEASPLPGWTEPTGECERALNDAAKTASGDSLENALRELPRAARAARHGLSTALLDADAKADGVALSEWLADERPSEPVPVNATIGDADPTATANAAVNAVEAGFECCKLKVGVRSLTEDLDRIEAVRDAVGADVDLRVDANGSWSRETADCAVRLLPDVGVSMVEQPLQADDLAGLASLRNGPIDVAVDESLREYSPGEVQDAAAADVLVLKPMLLGGPGEAYTIARWARERGLDVVVTTTIDAVVARTAAVHVAAAIPDVPACGLATADMLEEDLGPDPAPVTDGNVSVPDGPGLGLPEVGIDD